MVPAGQLAAVQAELAAIGERLDAQTAKLDAVHEVAQVLAELLPLLTQGKFGAVIRALRASG